MILGSSLFCMDNLIRVFRQVLMRHFNVIGASFYNVWHDLLASRVSKLNGIG